MYPQDVKQIAVIGAGTMGHGIAQVFAQADMEVHLMDFKKDVLEGALKLIRENLGILANHGRVRREEIPGILGRIHTTDDLATAVRGVHFVMETVAEVTEVKKRVFQELEEYCPPEAVLASNTSGLNLFEFIEFENPSRLVFTHWFAPPHIIPLVEVAPGPKTLPEIHQGTARLMERIGKRPIIMKQYVQRFIVNRIQNAIFLTALEMIENNWASPEEIDLAVKTSLGVRLPIVGVIQSLDFNGLNLVRDVLISIGKNIPLIEEKVKQGHLGASTSRGIYDYGGRGAAEIFRKRDELFLKMLDHLESIGAFKPV